MERSRGLPKLPTIDESGVKGFDYTFWFGLYGPTGLPKDADTKLATASPKVLADTSLQERLAAGGNEVSATKPADDFAAWAAQEGTRMKVLMEQSGASVD